MDRKLKLFVITITFLCVVGCGEIPVSQLSVRFPLLSPGLYDMEFSLIPSGLFRMGSPEGEDGRNDWYGDENIHWVKLTKSYEMLTTEVTRYQWFAVMGEYPDDNECGIRDFIVKQDDYPVVCTTRVEVNAFIEELNNRARGRGDIYRLPTEAEWEYAARGYTDTPYSVKGAISSFAWHEGISDKSSHPVGQLKANLFGLYDVHGNVWERVSDRYEKEYPTAESIADAIVDPQGPRSSSGYVLRGGSSDNPSFVCRSAKRSRSEDLIRSSSVGFRLVRTDR